jgi:large subunit ribosomal protein L10
MRPEKEAILRELADRLRGARCALLLDHRGLTVDDLAGLRRELAPLGGRLLVAKNSLLGRAAAQIGWEDISAMLTGPTAVAHGSGDASELARLLVRFVRSHDKAAVKGACLDGKVLSPADVGTLSALPPREVMLALAVRAVAAPMALLAGVLGAVPRSLLHVLKAAGEKREQAA